MKVKHPNRFYLKPHMQKGWDGCIDYISKQGYARTGLLPKVTSLIEELNEEYYIDDSRKLLEIRGIPSKIGEFEARPYQIEAAKSIVYNTVGDLLFQRGILKAATNAGKTIIAALIYKAFVDAKAIIIINNSDLYAQFIDDMPKMFGDDWGYMQGKKLKWGNIMVCMAPTLRNNLYRYRSELAKYNIALFDECHLSTSKTNKDVLTHLINCQVRVGLSGTPLAHKDPTKNMDVMAFFGDVVYTISNQELIEMGHSTPVIIKIVSGNTKVKIPGSYQEEYKEGISSSEERTLKSVKRVKYYLDRKLKPILVVARYHEHVDSLYNAINKEFGNKYKVKFIHHKIKNRKEILDEFKEGKVDILIASLIIKLGQNMPLIRYMQIAAAGDSQINALQLLGRALRKHKSKKKVYVDDFYDLGAYLMRHSKHRIRYYKAEGFKVIERFKPTRK